MRPQGHSSGRIRVLVQPGLLTAAVVPVWPARPGLRSLGEEEQLLLLFLVQLLELRLLLGFQGWRLGAAYQPSASLQRKEDSVTLCLWPQRTRGAA